VPKIILLEDPVARTIEYLRPYVPVSAGPFLDVPEGWDWDAGELLVTVADVGGTGERDVALDDVRLMVEVAHEDSLKASRVCREIHGLLRAWRDRRPVQFIRTVQRPTYTPNGDNPSFTTIVELAFRATEVDVEPIS
jgi:hypothetical protein